MGILDSLGYGNQGGYAGLLDALMYPSPMNKPPEMPAQPLYDQMGTPFAAGPSTATDPFGPPPQLAEWAKQFAPQSASPAPSPFTGTAPAAPVRQFAGVPVLPPQVAAEPPKEAPPRMLGIGGYQMPQIGSAQDYTPQTAAASSTDFSSQSRQAAGDAAPQSLPPALGGGGGSILGRLGNPDGLIARLSGNDTRSIAQQNLKAQYDSLVPLVGHQKALLAVTNPEAGKTILAQALEKKQYGFTKLDNDTLIRTDPLTGKAEVAYGGGDANKTGVAGPDGKIIPYPEGLDSAGKKVFANEIAKINADASAGKKTEVQAKAEKFGNKMELAERNVAGLQGQGTSLIGQIASGVPLGNYVQTKEYQKYTQAKNNFITALLRDESGAAIGTQEFTRYDKELFPQPGDGPDVIAQKAEARKIATEAMKKSAGPGYKSPSAAQSSSLPAGWSVQVR